jgi:hypothetical protein
MKHINDPDLKEGAEPPLKDEDVREKKTGTASDDKDEEEELDEQTAIDRTE